METYLQTAINSGRIFFFLKEGGGGAGGKEEEESPRYEKGRDGSQDMIVRDEAMGHGLGTVLTLEQAAARQESCPQLYPCTAGTVGSSFPSRGDCTETTELV